MWDDSRGSSGLRGEGLSRERVGRGRDGPGPVVVVREIVIVHTGAPRGRGTVGVQTGRVCRSKSPLPVRVSGESRRERPCSSVVVDPTSGDHQKDEGGGWRRVVTERAGVRSVVRRATKSVCSGEDGVPGPRTTREEDRTRRGPCVVAGKGV